jgi:hypothetical protein
VRYGRPIGSRCRSSTTITSTGCGRPEPAPAGR